MSHFRPKRGFRVGKMRERIDVQSPTTDESTGEPIRTWSDLYSNEPASYEPASGGETVRGRQVESNVNAVFIVRYKTGYSVEQRVVFDSDNYGIVRVLRVDGGKRYLELHCKAVAD